MNGRSEIMKTKIRFVLFGVAAAVLAVEGRAGAACLDTDPLTSYTDTLLWNYSSCVIDDFNGQLITSLDRLDNVFGVMSAFELDPDEWTDRGLGNLLLMCSPDTEIAKFINSANLLFGGVEFRRDTPITESYHSTAFDYRFVADSGPVDNWHDELRYQPVDSLGPDIDSGFVHKDFSINLIQTSCHEYDLNPPASAPAARNQEANPVTRASTFVHEGWHGWEDENTQSPPTSCGHRLCPDDGHPTQGSCMQNNECDFFSPHPLGAEGGMKDLVHGPIQAATEFLCDLADTPSEGTALALREIASMDADMQGSTQFVNGPMPACYFMTFGQHFATCSNSANQCESAFGCGDGLICNPQSGCCEKLFGNTNPVCPVATNRCPTAPFTACALGQFCDELSGCCVTAPTSCVDPDRTPCDGVCACDQTTDCCSIIPK
jgi:hypothetical protein